MLPSNFIKFLALLGVAFLLSVLAGSSTSQAKENNGTDSSYKSSSATPPVDEEFKKLLSTVIDDDELTKALAQYMEIAPISHKSRSDMTSFIGALIPALIRDNSTKSAEKSANETQESNKDRTDNSTSQVQLAEPFKPNPMKKVVIIIIMMASCVENETCSDLTCSILEKIKKNEENQHKIQLRSGAPDSPPKSSQRSDHYRAACHPCPVPDFCPLPDMCKLCPGKPVCPCGEEPEGILIAGESTTTNRQLEGTEHPTGDISKESHESHHHESHKNGHRSKNNNRAPRPPRPPCWLPGQKNCTPTTTTGKPGASTSKMPDSRSSTKRVRASSTTKKMKTSSSTTKRMSSSSTSKGMSSSSTIRPESSSTTERMSSSTTEKMVSSTTKKVRTSSTKKMKASSTTKPKSSSTTERMSSSTTERMSTSTTERMSTSTTEKMSSTTTTTMQPSSSSTTQKSSGSTSMKPGSSTTKSSSKTTAKSPSSTSTTMKTGPKVINQKEEQSSENKKTITVDGKKTETIFRNQTVSNLEYLQLEDGLKYLLRNKTVVSYITDSLNALPFRSGGVEGKLADRVLQNFGEDTNRWQVKSKGSARSMTYSTFKRNLIVILRNLVGAIIRKKCNHCVKACENRTPQLPEDDIVCTTPTTTTTTTVAPTSTQTTTAPQSTTIAPSSTGTKVVPSKQRSMEICAPCEYRNTACPAPPGCMMYSCSRTSFTCDLHRNRTATTTKPSQKPIGTSSSIKPTSSSSGSSSSSTSTSKPSSSSASPKQVTTTTTAKPNRDESKLDPDFAPDDLATPRLGDTSADLITPDLDDMDMEHQITESDRFMESPCNGSICSDQKRCGSADLNEFTRKKSTPYIVNGETQKYGEWPSYAKIIIHLNEHDKSQCGGVLIGKRHVLTAGHCIRHPPKRDTLGSDGGDRLRPDQMEVVLGEHDRERRDKFEISFKVTKICSSSKFNSLKNEGSRFDFAILTLKNEVKFNDNIQPACLPYKPFPIGKQKCFAVGQGKMRETSWNMDYLVTPRFVQKMPVARKSCRPWGFNDHDRSRWCFTKAKGPGDTCNGDSGGPILCKGKDSKWYVMGLVSYGSENCDGAESPGWVAVYTRVPALVEQMHIDCLNKA